MKLLICIVAFVCLPLAACRTAERESVPANIFAKNFHFNCQEPGARSLTLSFDSQGLKLIAAADPKLWKEVRVAAGQDSDPSSVNATGFYLDVASYQSGSECNLLDSKNMENLACDFHAKAIGAIDSEKSAQDDVFLEGMRALKTDKFVELSFRVHNPETNQTTNVSTFYPVLICR
jgi:hypothetical protein